MKITQSSKQFFLKLVTGGIVYHINLFINFKIASIWAFFLRMLILLHLTPKKKVRFERRKNVKKTFYQNLHVFCLLDPLWLLQ